MSDQKINIQLSPFEAITIDSFLQSFKVEMNHPRLESLRKAITTYHEQVCSQMTEEVLEDAKAEQAMNQLLGREPEH